MGEGDGGENEKEGEKVEILEREEEKGRRGGR